MNQIKIKLYKSLTGCTPKQIKTDHTLGLKKINQIVVKEEKTVVRGMLKIILNI
ncbi:50S ribosomal protein L30 ['Planchonia careya' phytoplasma]|nr:50S ribosomal protein L30 ['Planchonia careya' phytoplasma]MDO8030120.1 50S ribosomal protein L30 ['Planchonia careya' phytoplasma]